MIVGRASVAPVLDPSRPVVGRGWLSRGEGPTTALVTTPGELPAAGVRLDRPLMPLNPALRWQISGMLHPEAAIGHRIVPIIANDPADLID